MTEIKIYANYNVIKGIINTLYTTEWKKLYFQKLFKT